MGVYFADTTGNLYNLVPMSSRCWTRPPGDASLPQSGSVHHSNNRGAEPGHAGLGPSIITMKMFGPMGPKICIVLTVEPGLARPGPAL